MKITVKNFKPATAMTVCNDALTKELFNINARVYETLTQNWNKSIKVVEGTKRIKGKVTTITSTCTLSFAPPKDISVEELAAIKKPLDQYDRAIMTAIISELQAGNGATSITAIYRDICGKSTDDNRNKLSDKQTADILVAIHKLRAVRITTDTKSESEMLGYTDGGVKFDNKPLINVKIVEDKFRGQQTKIIKVLDVPPLLDVATYKRQILNVDRQILDIGRLNSSRDNVAVKFYAMCRAVETLGAKKLTPTITLEDIFTKCNLTGASRDKKKNMRNVIAAIMDNLKAAEEISSYEFVKKDNEFQSVNFVKSK